LLQARDELHQPTPRRRRQDEVVQLQPAFRCDPSRKPRQARRRQPAAGSEQRIRADIWVVGLGQPGRADGARAAGIDLIGRELKSIGQLGREFTRVDAAPERYPC
jgi:hypothetical protein